MTRYNLLKGQLIANISCEKKNVKTLCEQLMLVVIRVMEIGPIFSCLAFKAMHIIHRIHNYRLAKAAILIQYLGLPCIHVWVLVRYFTNLWFFNIVNSSIVVEIQGRLVCISVIQKFGNWAQVFHIR